MTARERAKGFLDKQAMKAITRTDDPVQDLLDFVLMETGRVPELEDAYAVVLYLADKKTAEEIAEAFQQAKPNSIVRAVGQDDL